MTVDPLVYDLAVTRLKRLGWDNTFDFQHLAERLEDTITDYVADIELEWARDRVLGRHD